MQKLLASLAALVLVACAGVPADPVADEASASTRAPLRPLEFCGNGVDEDGDGQDRVCQSDSAPPSGPGSVAVLRGTAEGIDTSYDVEVRLIPDGDPTCPNPPAAWPSVEACVGKTSCSIQIRATVTIRDFTTGATVNEYTLKPRQCSGGGLPNTTTFAWNAQESSVNIAATSFGAGAHRLTLRTAEDGSLFGSGTVVNAVGAFDLFFAGVE